LKEGEKMVNSTKKMSAKKSSSVASSGKSSGKKTILVVDDSENIRYLLRSMLEIKGFNVVLASNGKECVEKLKSSKPGLMILDIMMPGMDGWEVCKVVRDQMKLKLPIIMLTARADDASKNLSEKVYNVQGYLTKPFLEEDLMAEINKLL
jgi:two-component system alkaline phosphatase synthesis response regulator PhoP